jgi:hypothetical protein
MKCVFDFVLYLSSQASFQENYSNPDVFDGFRHAKMREREGEGMKHGMVTPTNEYLSFGQGRRAWYVSAQLSIILGHGTDRICHQFRSPGRFFATIEIKTMFAYLLVNYDVKMAGDRGLPSELFFGSHSTPDPTAEVMFRKRRT